jgi:biopolymer transport protein ExbD
MGIQIGGSDEREAEVMVEMNTTPLIDVMLVLLVMLIITIPIQLHSVNLELPSTTAQPPPVEPKVVRIDITASGQLLWNGEAVTLAEPKRPRSMFARTAAPSTTWWPVYSRRPSGTGWPRSAWWGRNSSRPDGTIHGRRCPHHPAVCSSAAAGRR